MSLNSPLWRWLLAQPERLTAHQAETFLAHLKSEGLRPEHIDESDLRLHLNAWGRNHLPKEQR